MEDINDSSKTKQIANIKEKNVFNKKYLNKLDSIRSKNSDIVSKETEIANAKLSFPNSYKIKTAKRLGRSTFSLDDTLVFDINDPNLKIFHIQDTNNIKFGSSGSDNAWGTLNVLIKDYKGYDIKKEIRNLKRTKKIDLIDSDDNGYIYCSSYKYSLIRYFRKENTHIVYSMIFTTISECVQEFDRSKYFVK